MDELEQLIDTVGRALGRADTTQIRLVAAIAGLLITTAHADRDFSPAEAAHLRAELGRIQGLKGTGAEAVAAMVEKHALRLSTSFVPRFTRILREEGDRELRLEVLDVLLGMAAADGKITIDEVTRLRTLVQAMGLDQADYTELQIKYRDKLSFL
jgi:uncharacterized tellurite resistance protein B-like protein